jgi:hypothetical protein
MASLPTEILRARQIKNNLRTFTRTGIKPTRGFTLDTSLTMCARYTGRTYRQTEIEQAISDLATWIGDQQ